MKNLFNILVAMIPVILSACSSEEPETGKTIVHVEDSVIEQRYTAFEADGTCNCPSTPSYTKKQTCVAPDGEEKEVLIRCYIKKNWKGEACGELCESSINVCAGKRGKCS